MENIKFNLTNIWFNFTYFIGLIDLCIAQGLVELEENIDTEPESFLFEDSMCLDPDNFSGSSAWDFA
jgi:hypothetical protein